MSIKPFPVLYQFDVSAERPVDETITRTEGEGATAKTVTETTKVTKKVSLPFCIKRPSRIEREDADVERAVWETHFITKGILPQALLLKTYANYGGILSNEQKGDYNKMLAEYDVADIELRRLLISEPESKDAINAIALKKVELKQAIVSFRQEQAVFFNNTAESKARQKLIEWLVLHLSYHRPIKSDESHEDWKPLFEGVTTAEKLVSFDRMVEENNELLGKARDRLEFLATILASSEGTVSKEEVESFAATLNEGQA